MGHNVGSAAERAVNKSVKAEAVKARTDEQIFRDMEKNLDASLSVAPLDIRLLLKRYKELSNAAEVSEWRDITLVEDEDAASDKMISEGGPNGSEEKESSGS